MSPWKPCKRREFIRRLRKIGFEGPYSGARHQFLVYQQYRLAVPSNREFSIPQLRVLLHEVEQIVKRTLSAEEWDDLQKT